MRPSEREYRPLYDLGVIEPGQRAPAFELPDHDGRAVKLSDFSGQPVVVYFYPKADTLGDSGNS